MSRHWKVKKPSAVHDWCHQFILSGLDYNPSDGTLSVRFAPCGGAIASEPFSFQGLPANADAVVHPQS